MAGLRMGIAAIAFFPAIAIELLAIAFHGYQEDYGSEVGDTIGFSVPWGLATLVLGGLVIAGLVSERHRDTLSWLGFGLAVAMAIVFYAYTVSWSD